MSYDQVAHRDQNDWSWTDLTVVGAYVVKGTRQDLSTLLDLAVLDPETHSLLLRAGGADTRHGTTRLIDEERRLREASAAGFGAATGQMLLHLVGPRRLRSRAVAMRHAGTALRSSLILSGIVLLLAGAPLRAKEPAAEEFDVLRDEAPAASLPAAEIQGPDFHVRDPVRSDGLMPHYVIESRFGAFEALGRRGLRVRIHEITALGAIDHTDRGSVALQSVLRGSREDAGTVLRVATDPVGTLLGIPRGIAHLLGGYEAQAEEMGAQVRHVAGEVVAAPGTSPGSAPARHAAVQAGKAARRYADAYLGLTAAERRWYTRLQVDPYTDNPVLHRAVAKLAKVDAAASFGMRFAPVGVPFAGELRRAVDTINEESPAVLRKRRHAQLLACGLDKGELEAFENSLLLTPTRQTLLVGACRKLDGADGRGEVLRHAAALQDEAEAQVYLDSVALMLRLSEGHVIKGVLRGPRLPALEFADGTTAVFGAFDAVAWTPEVAAGEAALRELLQQDFQMQPERSLWLTGTVTPHARTALEARGWTVHEGCEPACT